MKVLKKIFLFLLWAVLAVVVYIVSILGFGAATDFQPEAVIPVGPQGVAGLEKITDSTLSFMIWNIGYGGLGEESEFFFDNGNLFFSHGQMVRAPKNLVEKNVRGIEEFVGKHTADFWLFQEIDVDSKRSAGIDEFDNVAELLPQHNAAIGINYKSRHVPIPILEPWHHYGYALSGVASYSKFRPISSTRFQLPGKFALPMRIFQLDRCVLVQRFATEFGKELVVFNVHNSAHDRDGSLKKQEMTFLRKMLLEEFEKGNYVVAGGDWNQCPPGFQFDKFLPGKSAGFHQFNIEPDFLPEGWTWAYDPTTPTNRKCRTPYRAGQTFITTIDFFLLSPNLEAVEVAVQDLNFQFSDHQPVRLQLRLK